jgi:cytochrome c oxidase assembly protein subunit 15
VVITLLILLEFSVGIASVLSGLPIALAVAHNWLAALLLLSLLKLLSLQQQDNGPVLDSPGH